jgi:tetratricopeptide (TPR) repeat protein
MSERRHPRAEEPTQPIDLEALQVAAGGSSVPLDRTSEQPSLPDEAASSEVRSHAITGLDPSHPGSPADEALLETTRERLPSAPNTVRRAELAHAMAAKMAPPGLPSDRRAATVDDESAPSLDDDDLLEHEPAPAIEEPETQTRLPRPFVQTPVSPAALGDVEITAVTAGGELPLGAPPDDARRLEDAATKTSLPDAEIEELAAHDLESVEDVDELAKTHAGDDDDHDSSPAASGALPRFSLADDAAGEAAAADPTDMFHRSDIGVAPITGSGEVMTVSEADIEEATAEPEPPPASRVVPGPPPSIAPRGAGHGTYQPPAPVKPLTPAHVADADDDEAQLRAERNFGALVDLYRLRLESAETPAARATLLHKIASVHEWELGDLDRAFDLLASAFDLRPFDEELAQSIDRVGRKLGRIGEIAERARKSLHTADGETRVALLGHLVYWYERVLSRGAEVGPWAAELERLDKAHPVAMKRAAHQAALNGDVKAQREYLLRALDRSFRRDEKVALHLQLASSYAGTPEAARHYEAAIAIDPSSIVALQGIERMGREQNKHAQVEWALERQVAVVETESERVTALLNLGELAETKFLRREKAAEIFERVLRIEPSNPTAMKALERCYHALRDWPNLARVLRARAENTYDKKAQVELLEMAAEVYESKLGDAAAAIEVHRDLLHADPNHRRALADLARLYERVGDWANVATYKARVAELAPTKRQASQLLVQLGDFLSAPERDPIAARIQYERAVTIDPTNAAAWEALQKMAAAAGDERRVLECLEARANAVDGPRQRAALWVEIARFHATRGDERAARDAYEQAIASDRTNEPAAIFLLDAWTREEEWADAAPLCELLVNAAVRDKDEEALFTRLRLQTRIAAALGDADKAMNAALAAIDARPDDADAQADLVAVCSQCREAPEIVARAKDHLARLAASGALVATDMLVKLAQLQRDAGDVDEAMITLERARAGDPESVDVAKELAETYLAQGDFPRACKLKVDLARNATSADARFGLLCEAGQIWAQRAQELEKAAAVYEEARRVKPLDHALLHTLMALYGELGRWDALSEVLEAIAQIQESPERKAKSLYAMAQVVRDKLGDPVRAADLFDEVLDIDKKRLEVFEELVRALTEAKDWHRLELSYRKMLARIQDDDEPNLKFALFHQLGLIYRDRLEDAALAFEALDAAARIRPDDAEVRKIVTELLVVTDNLDNAVARIRQLIDRDPHDAELYAELYELFLRQHYFDKAWCAVNILAGLRPPTPEQKRFHEDYAPMPLSEVPGQIVEQAWRSHLLHPDLDPSLTSLFALMTPAVARMRHANLTPQQQVQAVGRPFTPAHSRLHDAIRATFGNAAEILGIAAPELLLGDPNAPVPFAPALAPFGSILVNPTAVEARADSLVYVVGKRLAEQRPELCARAFFPSVPDLTTLLAAAVRVSRHEGAKDTNAAALDMKLSAVMLPHERDGIRSIVMQTMMEGGVVDVKRWSQAADLSSMRAGLLLCGDVEQARRSILAEPQTPADLTPREKIGELYKFATSDLYSDLRGAIGIAVNE